MSWSIDKCNDVVLLIDLISANMLGNTAGFSAGNFRVSNIV